jgi:anti-sigma B factor antagonist
MSVVEFSVRTAQLGGNAFVVTVTGEADMHSVPELDRALQGVVGLGGTAVVVDLAGVTFIDSTALETLLRHHSQFESRGGELLIVTQDRRVLRTFEITGLDRVFALERSLAEGVAALSASGGRS